MPLQKCSLGGKPGWKWGNKGKCYTYTPGDAKGTNRAKQKAFAQGIAIGDINLSSNKELQQNRITDSKTNNLEDNKMEGKLNKEETNLLELINKSVQDKMGDIVKDMVEKAISDDTNDDHGAGGSDNDDGADDSVLGKQVSALTKSVEFLVNKQIADEKAKAEAAQKEELTKKFNDGIAAAVAKTLEDLGVDPKTMDIDKEEKAEPGKTTKKSLAGGTTHTDDEKSLNDETITQKEFDALSEEEQSEMVGNSFRKHMGLDAIIELRKAAKVIAQED